MTKPALMKNLLFSFIPLLVFVLADAWLADHFPEQEATRYALILALTMGVIQLLYVFIKDRRLDRMLLLDTGLIVVLGGVSLYSGDEIFFKLKPALVQFILVIFMGFMAFWKPALLFAMTERFNPNQRVNEGQRLMMQRSAQGLVLVLLLHTILIVYAAYALSKPAWAFISGPLSYIVMGLYFVGMIAFGRIKARSRDDSR